MVAVKSLAGFAGAFHEAVVAVLDAIVTAGDERREHLEHAKRAVEKALRDSRSGAEWYLAEHLRQGIKDVEARTRDAA
ncbi:hypothetical protein I546_4507 [Mycobacterium kansasii 732]|nr:hypothetical protein I546_4507 [Mycobacterium kansasii 732]KZS70142.1 hypothetical protein A4G27_21465 [Mycobacterium kansasii]